MKFKSNINFDKLKKDFNKRVYKALETSGNSTILTLKKRIKKGVNAKGSQFKSLNKTYKASKAKRGKIAMFELEGDMLRAITHETKKNNILRFYFDDEDMNKRAHYNIDKHKRDFFELSDKEVNKIQNRISDSLNNL